MTEKRKVIKSLHELDYGRLFMAVVVLLGHCVVFGNSKVFGDATLYFNRCLGCMVVPYFFSLSGFFIKNGENVYKTGFKMARRLLSLYFIWSVLYIPIHIVELLKAQNRISYLFNALKTFAIGNFPLWYLLGGCIGIMLSLLAYRLCRGNVMLMLICAVLIYIIGAVYKYKVLLDVQFVTEIGAKGAFWKFTLTDAFIKNGFLFGLPFIVLGMYIREQFDAEKIPGLRICSWGIIISMIVGLIEIRLSYVVSGFVYAATGNQLKLFLYPATYFLICLFIRTSEKTEVRDTKNLRKFSALIYFVHWEIKYFLEIVLRIIGISSYIFSLLLGVATLLLSVLVALTVMKLSKRYATLKMIY